MWFKKKEEIITPIPIVNKGCEHKWLDFPAYIQSSYDSDRRSYEVEVKEPYVCVFCKKRKDEVIARESGESKNPERRVEELIRKFESYDIIAPRLIVEDMVKDFQNVDRDYLAWYDYLHNKGERPNIELKL